jgi:hypothetical protein
MFLPVEKFMPGVFIIVPPAKGKDLVAGKLIHPPLNRNDWSVSFVGGRCDESGCRGGRGFERREQPGLFQQAAEIFFAGDVQRAFLGTGVDHGFIFHFEPFQLHDAEVFPALFPNLTLAEFHRGTNDKNLPPLILRQRRQHLSG